jgi:hypothetical protein
VAISRETLRRLLDLRRSVGGEADAAVRTLAAAWTRSWRGLAGGWQSAITDLVALAQRLERWPAPLQIARVSSVQSMLAAAEDELAALSTLTTSTVVDGAATAIAATAAAEPAIIASQLPADQAAELAASVAARILPAALDVIRTRATQAIVAQTRPLGADAEQAMRRELIRGVRVGANPNEAARRMVAAVNGAFEGGLVRATAIARTEMLDAHRTASRYVHDANADVLQGWRWLSTLDRRGCSSCWSMHGRLFPLSQPGPWDHVQGRCVRLPAVKPWSELGIDAPEPPDMIPDAQARFAELPQVDRLAIMGRARLALLDAGHIEWDDLAVLRDNSGWRPTYQPRPVRDLQRLADRRHRNAA